MSTRGDPLAGPTRPDRVHYQTGVLLGAEDFSAEQTYHRGRLARALAALHGSGTVAGLRVRVEPPVAPGEDPDLPEGREERLLVEPGLALDPLGRMIELPRSACIRLQRWYEDLPGDDRTQGFHGPSGGVVVDVFVRFVACERGLTPAAATGPFDALDAVAPSRLRDAYELELFVRREDDPPLPAPRWPDLAAESDEGARREALHEAILEGSWLGANDPLPEHAAGQAPTDVFLARLVLPATEGPPPERDPEAEVEVDNTSRRFVYGGAGLARWIGV